MSRQGWASRDYAICVEVHGYGGPLGKALCVEVEKEGPHYLTGADANALYASAPSAMELDEQLNLQAWDDEDGESDAVLFEEVQPIIGAGVCHFGARYLSTARVCLDVRGNWIFLPEEYADFFMVWEAVDPRSRERALEATLLLPEEGER